VLAALLLALDVSNSAAPHGIVSFELAGTAERADEIVESWKLRGQLGAARLGVWIDFAFILAYVSLLVWASMAVSEWCISFGAFRLERMGLPCAVLALLAGWLDAFENVGMLIMLSGEVTEETATYVMRCASVKFALIGIVIAYLTLVTLLWLLKPIGTLAAAARNPYSTPE
jgi:hypothetical protein